MKDFDRLYISIMILLGAYGETGWLSGVVGVYIGAMIIKMWLNRDVYGIRR